MSTEKQTIEVVDKEINYMETNYKLRFKSPEGLFTGIEFLNDTINEWTKNGTITYRKAFLDINEDELYIGVTMRIEGSDDMTDEQLNA